MNSKIYGKRKQKWEEKSRGYRLTPSREATFILTVKNTLNLLKNRREGKVLDMGCGFGEIDILLAQNTSFNIIGCDISDIALKAAQNNIKRAGLSSRIKIEKGDIYNLKYPDESFDIVFGFGYVSAPTYPGVQKEVARILKPGGILICDFINCLSFYKLFNTFKRIVKRKDIPYYVSLNGIRRKFEREGLVFINQQFFNTYPPIDFNLKPKIFLAFEDSIGKIFKTFLGRVRLVSFKKVKS